MSSRLEWHLNKTVACHLPPLTRLQRSETALRDLLGEASLEPIRLYGQHSVSGCELVCKVRSIMCPYLVDEVSLHREDLSRCGELSVRITPPARPVTSLGTLAAANKQPTNPLRDSSQYGLRLQLQIRIRRPLGLHVRRPVFLPDLSHDQLSRCHKTPMRTRHANRGASMTDG